MTTIYAGPVINPQSLSAFLALPRCLIAVDASGNILWIDNDVLDIHAAIAHHAVDNYTLVQLNPGEFIIPGFIDTHTVRRSPLLSWPPAHPHQHACQFPNLGVYAVPPRPTLQ